MCGAKKKAKQAIAAVTQQANTAVAAAQAETAAVKKDLEAVRAAAAPPAPVPAATLAATLAPQPTKPVMPEQIASYDNAQAYAQADIEARLRRRRAGAAANVLTSPTGIPATPRLGGVAA